MTGRFKSAHMVDDENSATEKIVTLCGRDILKVPGRSLSGAAEIANVTCSMCKHVHAVRVKAEEERKKAAEQRTKIIEEKSSLVVSLHTALRRAWTLAYSETDELLRRLEAVNADLRSLHAAEERAKT